MLQCQNWGNSARNLHFHLWNASFKTVIMLTHSSLWCGRLVGCVILIYIANTLFVERRKIGGFLFKKSRMAKDTCLYVVQSSMNLELNILAAGAICTVQSDHQQFVLLLLGAIKRNVTPHSKWWDLTYGIKASLKLHLLQKWLCLSGDFQAEKVTPRMQKGRPHFLLP